MVIWPKRLEVVICVCSIVNLERLIYISGVDTFKLGSMLDP